MREHIVPILFPIASENDYRYRDNFLNLRDGKPRGYNHVALAADGTLERRHDGIDVYVHAGTPIVAPFTGVVIHPGWRWKPWYPERYGITVAVLSTERGSRGYLAVMSHLATAKVRPGDTVKRGQVIGTQGDTGNAKGQSVHLHFELRSPFLFAVREAGAVRRLDAFNPYASLVAADPRRR
jgi:murein DD-endopeptidase MepM/ murein hydrolase activator NlpD